MQDRLTQSYEYLLRHSDFRPKAALVLGSGLGRYADQIESVQEFSYADVPGWPVSTAPGHAGKLIFGYRNDVPVAAFCGRFHCYEGYTPRETVLPLQAILLMGAKHVLLTNASGAIHPRFRPGSLMLLEDHINLTGFNCLTGANDDRLGPRFPDMSQIYSTAMNDRLQRAAEESGFYVERGVYAYMHGPSYETPAEIRALRVIGADAVGMSTVHEAVAANHAGAQVAAISCLSNLAAGVGTEKLSEEEVLLAGEQASDRMQVLADAFVNAVGAEQGA